MRSICPMSNCEFKDGSKVHEAFEGAEGLRFCWFCGDKILQAIADYEKEMREIRAGIYNG